MRLIGDDEQFTHQVALPHAMVGTSDPSWRERIWLTFHDVDDEDIVVSLGLGKYPNTNTFEGFVIAARDGRQRNLRLARDLSDDLESMAVGPLKLEVLEPFERLRLRLDENPTGIRFDIEWHARTMPVLEDRHHWVQRQRVTYDALRYIQHGRVSGDLHDGDESLSLDVDHWWSARDHSWGTRQLPRRQGDPPGVVPEWTFLLFLPIQLPDLGVHLFLYETAPGSPVHLSGAVSPPHGTEADVDPIADVQHDLEWVEGAPLPSLAGGELVIETASGRRLPMTMEATGKRVHLRGGGYEGWDGWYQGHWKSDRPLQHEAWDLNDLSQQYRYGKAGSDHIFRVTLADEVGWGCAEYIVRPTHPAYGHAVPPKPRAG